jgi:hypothetical protein
MFIIIIIRINFNIIIIINCIIIIKLYQEHTKYTPPIVTTPLLKPNYTAVVYQTK